MPLSVIETNPPPPQSPPRLTPENLQHPSLQVSTEWSIRRIRDFVQTQKNLSGYYSQQGVSYYQHWEEMIDQPVGEGDALANRPGPSAFATPILKPRAPKHAHADFPQKEPLSEAVKDDIQPETLPAKPNLRKATDKTDEGNPVVFKSLEALRDSTNIDEPVTSPKKRKPQATSTKELENTKQSESKLDEHEQRLAERRERRRAKREIVKPPTPPSPSSRSESSVSGKELPSSPDKVTKKRADVKNRKGRKSKSKIIPGIALMETFSAGNLGKERLTLKPATAVGLFNKGRSSANGSKDKAVASQVRAGGAKGKKAKAVSSMADLMFPEFAFLKPSGSGSGSKKRAPLVSPAKSTRTKQRQKKKRIVIQEESGSDESVSSHRSSISPTQSPPTFGRENRNQAAQESILTEPQGDLSKKERRKKAVSTSKAQLPPPSNSSDASDTSSQSRSNASRREPKTSAHPPEKLRYLSPPWEIDGSLVGDLVPASEQGGMNMLQTAPRGPSPSASVSEKVVVVSGKWGLAEKEVTKEARESRVVEEAKEVATAKENKMVNGTRSRFFPASHPRDEPYCEAVGSTNVAVPPQPHRGELLQSPKAPSPRPWHACPEPLYQYQENQQAHPDTFSDSVTNHANTMNYEAHPTSYYNPNIAPHQHNYTSGFEYFSVSSRVASPDFDRAEDFTPQEDIIAFVPDFEQGLAFEEEYPTQTHFGSLPAYESFYFTDQGTLQQHQGQASDHHLWIPQSMTTQGPGASAYVTSTSKIPREIDLECGDLEMDHAGSFEGAYCNYEGGYGERHPYYASQDLEYDHEDFDDSLDDENGLLQTDRAHMGDQSGDGRPSMLDDFSFLDDSIEYHRANQQRTQIPPYQEPWQAPSPNAHHEIEEEEDVDANGEFQGVLSASDRLGSNFKHGRALLLGIQQVDDGGIAVVDNEFARGLWKR
ncbi:hypothetical protein FRC04_007692 [Tulasnella sp. 424]|nr:hypothetical protein FRC04_007692 [Tulasnella sp. 424]KAG8979123.1 hypothetical protein FRC05_009333 [Tulasnella sp. 425]